MKKLTFIVPDMHGVFASRINTATDSLHFACDAAVKQTQGMGQSKIFIYENGQCVGEIYIYPDAWRASKR